MSGSHLLDHGLHNHVVRYVVLVEREFIIQLFSAVKQSQLRRLNTFELCRLNKLRFQIRNGRQVRGLHDRITLRRTYFDLIE